MILEIKLCNDHIECQKYKKLPVLLQKNDWWKNQKRPESGEEESAYNSGTI